MGTVRLGKLHLKWCDNCNLPILEEDQCPACGEPTYQVTVTPPGDIRPAFEHDIHLIRQVIDEQFGEGCGVALIPVGKVVILNKCPALDRMDEVIIDGRVVGTLRFDLDVEWTFVTRCSAARTFQGQINRSYVTADPGAVGPIQEGANMLAPGIVDASNGITPGDEIVVMDQQRRAIATGIAKMSTEEMMASDYGLAVKTRWTSAPSERVVRRSDKNWEDVLRINIGVLKRREREAVRFLNRMIESHDLPPAVSFSGGKDSLTCLLLSLEAGHRLPLFFLDTGLEFEETVTHVKALAEEYDLELIVEEAPDGVFFSNLDFFGPPGRDYRWCCKTNKLGPVVKAIKKHFPSGVLSLIGQRRYESEQRADKSKVWRNPWTPGQLSISPIQDWTALHVWLYIMWKGVDYNPWYEKGLDRIGCVLCPASDLAELMTIREESDQLERWDEYLYDYAEKKGLPESWVEKGLWRWKEVPQSIMDELERLGEAVDLEREKADKKVASGLTLHLQEGHSFCVEGFRIMGAIDPPLDLFESINIMNLVGEVVLDEERGKCRVAGISVYDDGALVARGGKPQGIRDRVTRLYKALVKGLECVGCGVCIGNCTEDALSLVEGKIRVDESLCNHCGKCIEPCPTLSFGETEFEF